MGIGNAPGTDRRRRSGVVAAVPERLEKKLELYVQMSSQQGAAKSSPPCRCTFEQIVWDLHHFVDAPT